MNEEIYQVPLAEFAVVRDRLAARLKALGNRSGSAEVKRARKPTVPAWAANQVVWQAPGTWERLQAAVEALRKSHEDSTSPEDVRQASREQREAVRACETRAAEILARDGHATSPAVLDKVGQTLLALALGAPGAAPGRLDHELQPPGFEALAGLSLPAVEPRADSSALLLPGSSEPRPTTADGPATLQAGADRSDQERARQAAALAAADAQRERTRRAVTEARGRLASDEERLQALESEMAAARRACEESRRRLEIAQSEHAASEAALRSLGSGEPS